MAASTLNRSQLRNIICDVLQWGLEPEPITTQMGPPDDDFLTWEVISPRPSGKSLQNLDFWAFEIPPAMSVPTAQRRHPQKLHPTESDSQSQRECWKTGFRKGSDSLRISHLRETSFSHFQFQDSSSKHKETMLGVVTCPLPG